MALVPTRAASRRRAPVETLSAATLAVFISAMAGTVGAADQIYWANESGNQLRVANLADGSGVEILDGAPGGVAPCGVAIDATAGTDGTLYYADFSADTIWARDLGTGVVTPIIVDEDGACGVAVDPATDTIYWAAFGAGTIRALTLEDSSAVTLFSGESGPSGVAIDPAGGRIYWTNQLSGAVRVGNLDGSGAAANFSAFSNSESNPLGVALDVTAGTIYWTNLSSSAIRRANLDGLSPPDSILFAGSPNTPAGAVVNPFGIAIDPDGGRFYWANFFEATIWSAPIDASEAPTQLGTGAYGTFPNFPVLLRAPVGTALPVVSGDASVGSELTCGDGTWASDVLGAFLYRAPHGFAFQWKLDGGNITGATGSTFTPSTPGNYSCQVTASNHADTAAQTSSTVNIGATLELQKLYDANANGPDAGDSTINGWRVQVDGVGTFPTPKTLSLNAGNYIVREATPRESNWVATSDKVLQIPLGAHDMAVAQFSNVCIGAGGAKDTGFWKNKTGQALVNSADLVVLSGLNLRTEAGGNFDPATFSKFADWIGKASGTNMAYQLSAQFAAMTLNVRKGMVNGNRLIQAPGATSANSRGFATISALLNEANTELGAHGLTKSGSPFRAYQAALQDALARANTNKTFVQPTPCAFSFQ